MSTAELHTSLGNKWSPRLPARVVERSQRLALVLGVLALIPTLAATGLSLPLPAAVERIAAALVPWAEAATLADQPVERSAVGSIVLTPVERSSGLTAPLTTDLSPARAQPAAHPKPKKTRATAHGPKTSARKAAAPTSGGAASGGRAHATPNHSTPILASSEAPGTNAGERRSDNGIQPNHGAGAQPQPSAAPEPNTSPSAQPKSDPVPTQSPTPQPNPIQQTVETVAAATQTVATTTQNVVTTTQTVVDKTVPVLQPVTGLVGNLGGVTGGGLLSGSNSGSGSSNSGSGSSNSGSGSGSSGSGSSGSGSSGSGSSGSGP